MDDHSSLYLRPSFEGEIVAEHMSYTYDGAHEKALDDINLVVQKGEFLVMTGASGCGKTTLAMSFVGAVPHFYGGVMEGMVFVQEKAITQERIPDLAMHIGTVLADYDTQLVTMTVGEEIAFAMENRGFHKDEIEKRRLRVLETVGLGGLEDRKVTDLSGGQRQRLAIGAALVTEPDILILDEPASSLDPKARVSLYSMLGTLHKEKGLTIIVVENSLEDVLPYCDRLALFDKGRLLITAPVEECLHYMYEENIYKEAIPSAFLCLQHLREKGCSTTMLETAMSRLQEF